MLLNDREPIFWGGKNIQTKVTNCKVPSTRIELVLFWGEVDGFHGGNMIEAESLAGFGLGCQQFYLIYYRLVIMYPHCIYSYYVK